ncbi:hypothetical protein [Rhodopseudomonas telluris]|uniref:Polymerase beta nucleotidyltransferase domain-containing protein n=1 Tax=Rhodopseudomonas telluris TaxID=644215 RepID=A0ABV6EXL9_9BRAD
MPQKALNTVIVDPQSLIRDVLSSLLQPYSFNIVGAFASIHKIDDLHRTSKDVDLTILSGQSVENALVTAEIMSAAYPGGKVFFLFDELSSDEMCRLCSSPIDGCVSLHVSHDLLMRSIEFVVGDNVRIFTLDESLPGVGNSARHRRSDFYINQPLDSSGWGKDSSVRLESPFFGEGDVFSRDSNGSVVGKGSHRRH